MEKLNRDALTSFTMLDGSQIREPVGSASTPTERRSLVGATPRRGRETAEHGHPDDTVMTGR